MSETNIVVSDDEYEYNITVDECGVIISVYNDTGYRTTSCADWSGDVVLRNAIHLLVEKLNMIEGNTNLLKNNGGNNNTSCKLLN